MGLRHCRREPANGSEDCPQVLSPFYSEKPGDGLQGPSPDISDPSGYLPEGGVTMEWDHSPVRDDAQHRANNRYDLTTA